MFNTVRILRHRQRYRLFTMLEGIMKQAAVAKIRWEKILDIVHGTGVLKVLGPQRNPSHPHGVRNLGRQMISSNMAEVAIEVHIIATRSDIQHRCLANAF